MAETTIEGLAAGRTNGQHKTIEVQNPATGEVIASVPALSPEDVAAVVTRARAAQPGWDALGFDGRAKVLKRAQKWVIDNADRIARTIVSRERQGLRGRPARRGELRGRGLRVLGQARPQVPGGREGPRELAVRNGAQARSCATSPWA